MIALVGGVLGALIGGGTSFAAQLISNSTDQLQFTYAQERTAYVQVATATDTLRNASADMVFAAANQDQDTYKTAQSQATASFVRFSQAYNEAYFVLDSTVALERLYDAARELNPQLLFDDYDAAAQDRALNTFDDASIDFLEAGRTQIRERLSEAG